MVTAIVLEEPPWFLFGPGMGPREKMSESPLAQWLRDLENQGLEQIVAESRQAHPAWPEPYVRAWCQGKKELDVTCCNWTGRATGRGVSAAIQCPALLITAEPDLGGIVTPEVAERMVKEMNPNFRVINFPGVGHHVRFAAHVAICKR